MYQTNVIYIVNLHSIICQIHFNEISLKLKIHEIQQQSARCERGKNKELYYQVGSAVNKIHESRAEKPFVMPSKEKEMVKEVFREEVTFVQAIKEQRDRAKTLMEMKKV